MKMKILKWTLFGLTFTFLGFMLSGQLYEWRGVRAPEQTMHGANAYAQFSSNPNIFVELSKKVVPSVVNIATSTIVKGGPRYARPGDELFRRFFEDFFGRQMPYGGEPPEGEEGDGPAAPRGAPRAMSLGTGFIIDEGLILTNNHVVQNADEIKINFTESAEEEPTSGEVVGRDPELDLALIKVKTKPQLKALPLGDSDKLEVGEFVIAVGNPFGQGHSVTQGIISAKDRKNPELAMARYLQTDAPINPGNSGGPLVNIKGEVIGINNAIDARAQGIGFAIPINSVKAVLNQLKTKGSVSRGYIGVLVNDVTPEVAEQIGAPKNIKSPFVAHVYPGTPADKAGLKTYDLILKFNGKKISNAGDLIEQVTQVAVGSEVTVIVLRSGKELELKLKVAERPQNDKQKEQRKKPNSKKESPKKTRPDIGIEVEEVTPEVAQELGFKDTVSGVVVNELAYGSPAAQSGLYRGDVIVEVNQVAVKDVDQFYKLIKPKKKNLLRVRRASPQGESAQDVFAVVVLDLK